MAEQPPRAPSAPRIESADEQAPFRAQHPLCLAQHRVRVLDQLQRMGQQGSRRSSPRRTAGRSEGAHSVTPADRARGRAESCVACERLERWRAGPQAPLAAARIRTHRPARARAGHDLLAQHAPAQGAVEPTSPPCCQASLSKPVLSKKLANFICYRLNTPQNVNHQPLRQLRRAAGSRVHR